jgi:hypothetical protein
MAPEPDSRAKLERIVGIPVADWDGPPAPLPAVQAAETTLVSALPPDASAKSRAYAHMVDISRRYQAAIDSGKATVRDLATLDRAYSTAIATYGKLSGELELTEAQITRSPAFARIATTIFNALADHPQAAEAIVKALRRFDGVSVLLPDGVEDDA